MPTEDPACVNVFHPPAWVRPTAVQTVLASLRLRARGTETVLDRSRSQVLHVADGVRLLGFHTPHPAPRARAILLHGWEGSSDSTYIRTTARTLHRAGCDVFRINLRDHGPSHHLNEGIFLAVYLDEALEAATQAATQTPHLPVFLCGFSLGGNFALRIAARWADAPPVNLRRVVAISPAIDPIHATERIDGNLLLLWYFRRKWRRSLLRKQQLFPDRYDFSDLPPDMTLMQMTERLIPRHSRYPNARTYLAAYAVNRDVYARIRVPATVITAEDDPVIAVQDLLSLPNNPAVERIIHRFGGHNGFIEGNIKSTWYEKWLVRQLCG